MWPICQLINSKDYTSYAYAVYFHKSYKFNIYSLQWNSIHKSIIEVWKVAH